MQRLVAPTALLLLSLVDSMFAASGQAYTVTVSRSGTAVDTKIFEVVSSDGRLRVVYRNAPPGEGILYDSIVRGSDSAVAAINSRNGTWYPAPELSPFALDSGYLSPHPRGKVKNLKIAISDGPAADGEHHYAGEVRYDVGVESRQQTIKVSCVGKFVVDTTSSAAGRQWLGRMLPQTGYREVDAALRSLEERIEGLPVHLALDTTRTYAGGPPMVESVEVTMTSGHDVRVESSEFVRPAGYRLQEPVIATPGAIR